MTEEDKGAYRYCKNCGRVLSPTYEAELCPTCEENQLFDKVRDYIRKNDVTEMQVAEHFGIPQKKVKAWIKEGRIEYKEDGDKRHWYPSVVQDVEQKLPSEHFAAGV